MCEEYSPSLPVARLLGRNGFGDSFSRVKDGYSENIQELNFLGGSFTWKYAAVCGGRIELDFFVSD